MCSTLFASSDTGLNFIQEDYEIIKNVDYVKTIVIKVLFGIHKGV